MADVKTIAEIKVRGPSTHNRRDSEIAEAVVFTLKWNTTIPDERINVKVKNGIVMLGGEAEWDFQRSWAKSVVENLKGVRSVINLITIIRDHSESSRFSLK